MNENETYCGYIAISGRPNVGKSTLMNHLLGKKISIISRKPQTTRQRILGIKTVDNYQFVYVDLPGWQKQPKRQLNRFMNRVVKNTLENVAVVLLLIDAREWTELDEETLKQLPNDVPVIIALNKIDKVPQREHLLPLMEKCKALCPKANIVPISAKHNEQLDVLEQKIATYLPSSPFYFSPDQTTDRSDQFLASEIIREKLMRSLGDELPYSLTVTLDVFRQEEKLLHIAAVIWVEKESHKPIIIGKKGEGLKKIGSQARLDLEKQFDQKVYLQLWIKVKENWQDNEKMLQRFGFEE